MNEQLKGTPVKDRDISFRERLFNEKVELDEKLERLTLFLQSEKSKDIEPFQLSLLNIQEQAMLTYSKILLERISWIKNPYFVDELAK